MKTLVIIPARGGSKGIPGKNIKLLNGKPLIHYAIDIALALFNPEDVCVSTDDPEIKKSAEVAGLPVPFLRPEELATDTSSTNDVILHALKWYKDAGKEYDSILLLQPTSPFRTVQHINEAFALWDDDTQMIVGVRETDANPYYVLFEEDAFGHLQKSKEMNFLRRQDCPQVWQINGALYIISVKYLLEKGELSKLEKKKYIMNEVASVDIDTPFDWLFAEFIAEKGIYKYQA